jgi:hypothetical protein
VLVDELESYGRGGGQYLGAEGVRLEAEAIRLLRKRWPAAGLEIRRGPQHGDFALSNVLEADGGLVVFDWERFGRVELPGFDALHHATYLSLLAVSDKKGWRPKESVTALLSAGSPGVLGSLGTVIRRPLADCLTSLGFDPDGLDALLALYLLAYAREYGNDWSRRGMMRVVATQLAAVLERG